MALKHRPEDDPGTCEMFTNLGDILRNAAREFPDYDAIKNGANSFSFSQVFATTSEVCQQIRFRKIQRDEKIALLIPNGPAFSIYYFAALWAGAIVVPINPLVTDRELLAVLQDCEASILFLAEREFQSRAKLLEDLTTCQILKASQNILEQPSDRQRNLDINLEQAASNLDDTAVILYTSGSTGGPKGVELTHRNLIMNAKSVSEEKFSTSTVTNTLGPGHVALASLPLSHAFGQTNMQNGIWYHGGAIVYQERFDPTATLELIAENQVTFFAGVPTMYVELLKAHSAATPLLESLQFCVCGGASLSASLKDEFSQNFGISIQESYGLTETSPMISCQQLDRTYKAGCVGKAIYGVEVRVVDERGTTLPRGSRGELQVRGHNVFRRYLNKPAATKEVLNEGWFSTGDIACLDEDDEIWIVNRKKEMIKRGGYSVYPSEVESVIDQLDVIREVAVVGVPHERLGEEIKAFVVPGEVELGEGEQELHSDERCFELLTQKVRNYCEQHLAAYKCPRIIEIMGELPKGSTGKVDRQQLETL